MPWSHLDALTHRNRVAWLVDLGRRAAGDAELQRQIDDAFASPDAYRRSLALTSAFGSKNATLILRGTRDRSRTVRQRALKWVPIVCSVTQAASVLQALPLGAAQARLAARLMQRGKAAAVDAVVCDEFDKPHPEQAVADLLAFCTPATVQQRFAELAEHLSPTGWRRLACHHGKAVAQALPTRSSHDVDARARWRLRSVLPILAEREPDAALALVTQLMHAGELREWWLRPVVQTLIRLRPREMFDELMSYRGTEVRRARDEPFRWFRFDGAVHRLDAARLRLLVEHGAEALRDDETARRWFLRLSGGQRAAVLAGWRARTSGWWGGVSSAPRPCRGPRRELPGVEHRRAEFRRRDPGASAALVASRSPRARRPPPF